MLLSDGMVAAKLRELSGAHHTAAAVGCAFAAFKDHMEAGGSRAGRSKFVLGSLVWILPNDVQSLGESA